MFGKQLLIGGIFALFSTLSLADITPVLPRDTDGIGMLLGVGAGYDKTAYKTERTLNETNAAIAVFSDNFYLDIHQAFYRFQFHDEFSLKLYGRQDDLPNSEDIDSTLHVKSGDSFDVGLIARKAYPKYYVDLGLGVDVTGTHNGLIGQLSAGLTRSIGNTTWMFELGANLQDSKRTNYYYGVLPNESTAQVPAYESNAVVSGYVEAGLTYQISNNLGVHLNLLASTLPDFLKNSPRIDNDANLAEVEASALIVWQFPIYRNNK